MDEQKRFADLEMTVAFQERTVEELNKIVTAQQQQVDQLERRVKYLAEKVRDMGTSDILSAAEEPPPPHY